MRDDGGDLFFGASGYLLLILAVYSSIKNYKRICRFIRDFIKYEWLKAPKNWKKLK